MSRLNNLTYPKDLENRIVDYFRAGETTPGSITERLAYGNTHKLPGNFYDAAKELNVAMLNEYVKEVLNSFPNYDEVRDIYNNQIIVPKNDNRWYLYDSIKDNVVGETSEKSIRESVTGRGPVNNKITRYYTGYHPFSRSRFFIEENKHFFNSYSIPNWKLDWWKGREVPIEHELPEIYQRFFNHLFDGSADSINYVLDWIATSITSRNLCYLATIARPGIGKGVFSKILKGLHGSLNFVDKGGKSLASNFNGDMQGKTLIYINEFEDLKAETWEKVKRFIDDTIDIERKGIDREFVRNHASYYFSSNHIDALQIDEHDRRFSILDLTDKTFPYHEYGEELLQPANIEKLARHLWHRPTDKTKLAIPYLSKTKEIIKNMRQTDWQVYLDEEFFNEYSGKSITISDLLKYLKSINYRNVTYKNVRKYIRDSSKKASIVAGKPTAATIFLDDNSLTISSDISKQKSKASETDLCVIL